MSRMVEGSRRSGWPSTFGALTAALYLVSLISLSPHLVHHLFQPEEPLAKCAIAFSFERTHGIHPETATPIPPSGREFGDRPVDPATLPTLALTLPAPRAPPLPAS